MAAPVEILPTQCCGCRRYRVDGFWVESDGNVDEAASHGLCPECAKRLYPEFCHVTAN